MQKVDSAHTKLQSIEGRLKRIELLSDGSIIYRAFKKDSELRDEMEKLIWRTIVGKAFVGFLWILGGVIVIPLAAKIVSVIALRMFGVDLFW